MNMSGNESVARERLIVDNEIPPLPQEWDVQRFRFLFEESKERNGDQPVGEMLSVSEYRGVVPKVYENEEQRRTDEELQNYRVVRPDQLVVNTMWLNHLGLGVSEHVGHVSPAYAVYNISDKLDKRFVHYLLRSQFYLKIYLRYLYGIRPNSLQIKTDDWNSIPIILPPLDTQKTIADFLGRETARIDQLIEKKQRLVHLLSEKVQTEIDEALDRLKTDDCMTTKMGLFLRKVGSGKTPRGGAEVYVESGVKFLRSQNIHNDGLSLKDVAYIPDETDKEMSSTRVHVGDVLLNITGGSIGRCAVVKPSDLPANVSQHVSILRPFRSLDPEFLHLCILSKRTQDRIRLESFSANREGVTANDIKNLPIRLPIDLTQQRRVVKHVAHRTRRLAKLRGSVVLSIDRLREFRSALVTATVTGQIDLARWVKRGKLDRHLEQIADEMASAEASKESMGAGAS